jgi:hypothetical protein
MRASKFSGSIFEQRRENVGAVAGMKLMRWFGSRVRRARCILALSIFCASLVVADDGEGLGVLPDSLAKWYKPENKRQVWLHTMFAMRRELQAVREYAERQDLERLRKWAERLAAHYREVPEMVPEWEDEVEPRILERLEQAVRDGDFRETAAAAKRLGGTCRSCHREFRALAAARYRGPQFEGIEVPDASGSGQEYGKHMKVLSRALNRVKIASEDGRWEAADRALGALRTGLDRLGETCSACHEDDVPRRRILGGDAQESLNEIAAGLTGKEQKTVGRYLGQAAVQVCARCHGVHRILSDLTGHLSPRRR